MAETGMRCDSTTNMISLNRDNYFVWKLRMTDLLYVTDSHEPVFIRTKPESYSDEQWAVQHRKVCALIRQWVSDLAYGGILHETRADALWDKLESFYRKKSALDRFMLFSKLKGLKCEEGGSAVVDHIGRFQLMVSELKDMGLEFPELVQVVMLVESLPDSWDAFKMGFYLAPGDDDELTADMLTRRILDEEVQRKIVGFTSHRGRSQNRKGRVIEGRSSG